MHDLLSSVTEHCVDIFVGVADGVATCVDLFNETAAYQMFDMSESSLSSIRPNAVNLNSKIRRQEVRLVLFHTNVDQRLQRVGHAVTAQVRIVRHMWMHNMKNQCMAVEEIADELELCATPSMICVEVPRKLVELLRRTVLNVRQIN